MRRRQNPNTKGDKTVLPLLHSFDERVSGWLDLDDEILSVLQNVIAIRGRLPIEGKLLNSSFINSSGRGGDNLQPDSCHWNAQDDEWKHHGLRGKAKGNSLLVLPRAHARRAAGPIER